MPINSVKSLYGPPKVGGDTLSYCTRCKMELAHVIVSMIDTRPSKVLCKTCKTQHNYKRIGGVLPSKKSSDARPARKFSTSPVRVAEIWETKMAEKQLATIKPYQVTAAFSAGDVVQHTKFGVGIIEEVRSNNKVLVLFREGEKILVHSMGISNAT